MEIIFQNTLYFTGTWTHPARLSIPSMQLLNPYFQCKADNCDTCIEIVCLHPLLTMYLFVLSSRSQAHANQMLKMDVTEPLHPT